MATTLLDGSSSPTTTYQDGPGNPNQGSLIYAISSATWWYFQIQSSNDSSGNPGTHKVSAWYCTSGDPGLGPWTYYGDSPNLDHQSGSSNSSFQNGRSLGMLYWNNASGSNKDIAHLEVNTYPAPSASNSGGLIGHLRIVLGAGSLTWGSYGITYNDSMPSMPANFKPTICIARGTDGYISSFATLWNFEDADAAAMASAEADTGDTWTTGGSGTGNAASTNKFTGMSNQTGIKVGYGMTAGGNGSTYPNVHNLSKVNSIDSGTQVTGSANWSATLTGTQIGWSNMSPGTRTTSLIIDSSMTFQCNTGGLVPLASGAMLAVYDNGSLNSSTNFQDLLSTKSGTNHSAGLWLADNGGGKTVYGTNSSQALNDWCVCGVSTSAIYVARRTGATTCAVRNYVTASDSWQAITNAPPAMTGKTIVSGGGVCLVSDGTDMWLLVIDSTDAQIKYVKYTHGTTNINGTWGSWTNLASVGATAAFLTAVVANGYIVCAWSEKNANNTNYDTKVATLSIGSHAPIARTSSDLPSSTDSVAGSKANANTASDSPSTTDSSSRVLTEPRTGSDSPTTTDSVSRILTNLRSESDSPSTVDSPSRILQLLRSIASFVSTTDSASGIKTFPRSASDTPVTTDVVQRLVSAPRTLSDSPSVLSAISRIVSMTVAPADAPSTVDAAIRVLTEPRAASDAPSSLDAVVVSTSAKTISASDAPSTIDTLSKVLLASRSPQDTPSTIDAAMRILSPQLRTASDNPETFDTVVRQFIGSRTTSSAVGTSDVATKVLSLFRATSDTSSVSDQVQAGTSSTVVFAADFPFTSDVARAVQVPILVLPAIFLAGNVQRVAFAEGEVWRSIFVAGAAQRTISLEGDAGANS